MEHSVEKKVESPSMEEQDGRNIVEGVLNGMLGAGRVFQSSKDYLKYLAHSAAAQEDIENGAEPYWGYSQVQAQAVEDALLWKRAQGGMQEEKEGDAEDEKDAVDIAKEAVKIAKEATVVVQSAVQSD